MALSSKETGRQTPFHELSAETVAQLLESPPQGLSHAEAQRRLARIGPNVLEDTKRRTALRILLGQFGDLMVAILLVSAVISGVLGDLTDALIIIAIVVLTAVVGFIQEYRAERAMEVLKSMAGGEVKVIREGTVVSLPHSQLVPGDRVRLEAGDVIPADLRFTDVHQLKVDESVLTGESHNVEKHSEPLPSGVSHVLAERFNMGFKGTHVTQGRAAAIVVATGMRTELGRIAHLVQQNETVTPLQRRLSLLGKKLSLAVLGVCTLVFLFGFLRGEEPLLLLLTAVSLAVAAIPEALPAVVTVTLAMGARRLARQKALIRKLSAVETIGAVTYICADKTGTLTKNQMAVQILFRTGAALPEPLSGLPDPALLVMALNNDVAADPKGHFLGDSTEVALVRFAALQGYVKEELEHKFPRVGELPFSSDRKCMSTVHALPEGAVLLVKGAVESLLERLAPVWQSRLSEWEAQALQMATQGYRVLGLAVRHLPHPPDRWEPTHLERDLTLVALVGIMDPPREEAAAAVAECKKAGIQPVMITGDHKMTAAAIGHQLGILEEDDIVLTGPELDAMPEEVFRSVAHKVKVYARTSPEQKLRIITALQERGEIVAMTGDGVNDAPALKKAHIGIAMGLNGTEVAKEASHLILLDDNFATIVRAVRQGRRIFDNIVKFIRYTLTSNSGEIWAIVLAPFFQLPTPLHPVHILWVNLLTDGLPGLALASEPEETDVMERPPRPPQTSFLSGALALKVLWVGLLMGLVTLATQALALHLGSPRWQTMAFSVLCFSQLGNVLALRSERKSFFQRGLWNNKQLLGAVLLTVALQTLIVYVPALNPVFKTQPLNLWEWIMVGVMSTCVFWAVELEKWWQRRGHTGQSGKNATA